MQAPRIRILCVDDSVDTCDLIRVVLGYAGYEVQTAATMEDGLRLVLFQKEPFDLYLVDYRFEDGTGMELVSKIRTFDQKTPIIFHSADVRESIHKEALTRGVQAFIPKPSDPYALAETVIRLVIEARLAM